MGICPLDNIYRIGFRAWAALPTLLRGVQPPMALPPNMVSRNPQKIVTLDSVHNVCRKELDEARIETK